MAQRKPLRSVVDTSGQPQLDASVQGGRKPARASTPAVPRVHPWRRWITPAERRKWDE